MTGYPHDPLGQAVWRMDGWIYLLAKCPLHSDMLVLVFLASFRMSPSDIFRDLVKVLF